MILFYSFGFVITIMTVVMELMKESSVIRNIKHVLQKTLLVKISNVSENVTAAMEKMIAAIILMKLTAKKIIRHAQLENSNALIVSVSTTT